MNDLEKKPFGYLLKCVIDNRGRSCPTSINGIPLIATNCISNKHLYPLFLNVRYVDDDAYKKWFRGHPEPGDMIFVTKGTPGRIAWVPNPVNFCIAQDMVAIRADEKRVYPKYLFAALRSKAIQQEIEGLHVGTLIPHFKKGDFNDLFIPLPSKEIQEYIGNLYFFLSSKIDLLHRQNRTLEAMAETLFRQWFIEEADEGWEQGKISDLFILQRGYDLPIQDRIDGAYPIISSSGFNGTHSEHKVKGPGVVTGRSGLIGNIFYVKEDFWPLNTSLYIKEFIKATHLFSYFILKNLDLSSYNAGSSVPTLNRNHVHDQDILVPYRNLIIQFENIAIDLFEKIHSNKKQIRALDKLRDTLLPKLMSGDLKVEI